MRHLRVVLVDVEFHQRANPRHRVQGVQEQPLVLQRPPIGLDSRLYRVREGAIEQITEDHSLLNDYIRMKHMSESEIANFRTRTSSSVRSV